MEINWSSCDYGSGVASLDCVPLVLVNFIYWSLMFTGVVAVVFFIIGGITYIMSSGDPKKVDQAKRTIYFSILGVFLIFLSFFIINIIGYTTGVACIKTSNVFSFSTCN